MASSRIDPVNHHSSFGFPDTMKQMLPPGCGIELGHARNEELFEIEQYCEGGKASEGEERSSGRQPWVVNHNEQAPKWR